MTSSTSTLELGNGEGNTDRLACVPTKVEILNEKYPLPTLLDRLQDFLVSRKAFQPQLDAYLDLFAAPLFLFQELFNAVPFLFDNTSR